MQSQSNINPEQQVQSQAQGAPTQPQQATNGASISSQQPMQNRFHRTFDKYQMAEITAGIKKGINIKEYDNVALHPLQMREIRLALENGINPSAFNKQFVPPDYMKELRLAMQSSLDTSLLEIKDNKLIYTADQAREIRLGLEHGLTIEDVKSYSASYLSPETMKEARLGLQDGFEQMKGLNYSNYSARDLHSIRITLTANKIMEAIKEHARNLYERLIDLLCRAGKKTILHREEAAITYTKYICDEMDEGLENRPMEEKVEAVTKVMEEVVTKSEAMEQAVEAAPQEILEQTTQEAMDALAEESLKQESLDNRKQEYVKEFYHNEMGYNVKLSEFAARVMSDESLSQEQKQEILNETFGRTYGENMAKSFTERIEEQSQLKNKNQEKIKEVREAFEEYELQNVQSEEMEMEL